MTYTTDFQTGQPQASGQNARAVNNYACMGFQLLMDEYRNLEHPSREQQDALVSRARETLLALDAAASIDPNDHIVDLLVYENCRQIASAARDTRYYEQDEEGNWRSHGLPFGSSLELPGQRESWDAKAEHHRAYLEQDYADKHPFELKEKLELRARQEQIEADLGTLKDEKRSKGLFNFSERREVKDQMKPFKNELKDVKAQIRELEKAVDDHIEGLLGELEPSYTRLDF